MPCIETDFDSHVSDDLGWISVPLRAWNEAVPNRLHKYPGHSLEKALRLASYPVRGL